MERVEQKGEPTEDSTMEESGALSPSVNPNPDSIPSGQNKTDFAEEEIKDKSKKTVDVDKSHKLKNEKADETIQESTSASSSSSSSSSSSPRQQDEL